MKVYDKCANDCIQTPNLSDSNPGALSEMEKKCATNCIRKYDQGYKLYSKVEDTIFRSYMESTEIDPNDFYA